MAFVAQAADRRIMCYATANVLRKDADRMVPRFAEYWKEQTGQYPARLLFDSRATVYAGLNTLNQAHVGFITIRRRGATMLARVERLPDSSWQRCQITQAKGKCRQVRYVDELVALDNYVGQVRQLIVTGLGHESPTFFLTNDRPKRQTAREVIQTYASRNHVENRLGEQITFFHLALISTGVNCPNVFRDCRASVRQNGGTGVCFQTRASVSARRPNARPPAAGCASACLR